MPRLARPRVLLSFVTLFASTLAADITAFAQPQASNAGDWTAPRKWGHDSTAVHMSLHRGGHGLFPRAHSQLLWFGYGYEFKGALREWNAITDTCETSQDRNLTKISVGAPDRHIFCSGASTLRSGELAVVGGHEASIIGLRDAVFYDPATRSWARYDSMEYRRWYGTATTLPSGKILATAGQTFNHVVVFGGRVYTPPADTLRRSVDRLAATTFGEWDTPNNPATPATWPEKRENHSMANLPGGVAMTFGGRSADGALMSDAWVMDRSDANDGSASDTTLRYTWSRASFLLDDAVPAKREHHASMLRVEKPVDGLLDRHAMIVFGGVDTAGTLRNDVHRLHRIVGAATNWTWNNLTDSIAGTPPPARQGHAALYLDALKSLVVFGGREGPSSLSSGVWLLSLGTFGHSTRTWSQPTVLSTSNPTARAFSAVAIDDSVVTNRGSSGWRRLYFFGGETGTSSTDNQLWRLYVNSAGTQVDWQQLSPSGTLPAARKGASLVFDHEEDRLILFGGHSTDAKPWSLDLNVTGASWVPMTDHFAPRTGQTALWEYRAADALYPEIYDPVSRTWSIASTTPRWQRFYQQMFVDTTGKVFSAGPNWGGKGHLDHKTYRFDVATGLWQAYPTDTVHHDAGSAVMYRPGHVMKSGNASVSNFFPHFGWTHSLDLSSSSNLWRRSVNNMIPRANHNLVLMPTGEVMAIGGNDGSHTNGNPVRRPEIWDPDYSDGSTHDGVTKRGIWYGAPGGSGATLDTSLVIRGYHSTAMLLPDGRIFCGGGDHDEGPTEPNQFFVDSYCPPYLFQANGQPAARPGLVAAQDSIAYNQPFTVYCRDPIVQAVLIRPGAVTHGFNHDQRFVALASYGSTDGTCRQFVAPRDSNVAPPGDYLLFVLNAAKTPSIAQWVRLGQIATAYSPCDSIRPVAVSSLSRVCLESSNSAKLKWRSPYHDSIFVSGPTTLYELRYRDGNPINSMAAFVDSSISVASVPWPTTPNQWQEITVENLVEGHTYYFRLISRDGAGLARNWSALSNQVSFTLQYQQCGGGSGGGCCQEGDGGMRGAESASLVASGNETPTGFENTVLSEATSNILSTDLIRLEGDPHDAGGRVRAWIRESQRSMLGGARLIAVDHGEGETAFASQQGPVTGTTVAAEVVGGSRTAIDRLNSDFVGHTAETLLVLLPVDATHLVLNTRGISGGANESGILIEGLASGRVRHLPRREFEQRAHGPVIDGRLRLIFAGDHELSSISGLVANPQSAVEVLSIEQVHHSRLGSQAQYDSLILDSGDRLDLVAAESAVTDGHGRSYFLEVTGRPLPASTEAWNWRAQTTQPLRYELGANRPNPFRNATTIHFEVAEAVHVSIDVHDLAGRRVARVLDRRVSPGQHSVEWDHRDTEGNSLSPGVYFYLMRAGAFRSQRKMVLVP